MSGPGIVLPLAALAVAVLMVATWAEGVRRKDISIVDPVWGPAFVLVALVGAVAGDPGRRWLLLALTAAWGLRLGITPPLKKRSAAHVPSNRYGSVRCAGHALQQLAQTALLGLHAAASLAPLAQPHTSARAGAQQGSGTTWCASAWSSIR